MRAFSRVGDRDLVGGVVVVGEVVVVVVGSGVVVEEGEGEGWLLARLHFRRLLREGSISWGVLGPVGVWGIGVDFLSPPREEFRVTVGILSFLFLIPAKRVGEKYF